jgi:predicted dehydrogenase
MSRKDVRFGIIGGGLMGREFASATARWCHLLDPSSRPRIVALCARKPSTREWFQTHFPAITQFTADYREVLANPDVEAVYIAVPHHLHEEFYCAAIEAGKDVMGEKPFGIDLAANERILATLQAHPGRFVRCASEFPFYPALQAIGRMIEAGEFGRILGIESAFLHSSDLDLSKAINWKRQVATCGEYGCMGDLGIHTCHMPLRAGWRPLNVRAILSNIVTSRPDGKGGIAACETWDNATLLIKTEEPQTRERFPWTMRTWRLAPGEKNSWNFAVYGTAQSARFSTKQANTLEVMESRDGRQAWLQIDMGQETAYKTITGGIFEFGFSDSILQMFAAFLHERDGRPLASRFAGCVTPEETHWHHRLLTAALRSHQTGRTMEV